MSKATAIYCRVSTDYQAEKGISLEAQETRLRAYCELKGLEVAEIIREKGISGGKPLHERPGGRRLIELIEKQEIGHICAFKLDRLFRSAGDCATRVTEWTKKGINLHLLDVSVDTSTAMGRFFLNIMASVAELERGMIAERTVAALAHKRQQLEPYAPVPYGYKRNGDRLVEAPAEIQTVERILTMRQNGFSYHEIARELNRLQIPTKKGGQWYASTIRNICRNPIHQRNLPRMTDTSKGA